MIEEMKIEFFCRSSISYYWFDEMGTYIVGGSESIPSFRGVIAQMDIYRRIALTPTQVCRYLFDQMRKSL